MTAQIGDIYKYKRKEFSIVALSAPIQFEPKDYGLEPHASSTACWRGYWCEYNITDKKLFLQNLYLFNADGKYPPLNGIEVSPQEYQECICYSIKSEKGEKVKRPKHMGHRVYENINMPISYTGKILLGDGFMREYYIHMGFQRGWAYRKLVELIFENGVLLECNDLSHLAKEQREAIKKQGKDPRYSDDGNIPKFVTNSFSLDYAENLYVARVTCCTNPLRISAFSGYTRLYVEIFLNSLRVDY